MAFESLGTRFQPGIEENDVGDRDPIQTAVEVLNLRLPTVMGAKSPIAPHLLAAGGLGGQPENAAMIEHWRRLLGLSGVPQSRMGGDPATQVSASWNRPPLSRWTYGTPPSESKPVPPGAQGPDPLSPARLALQPDRPFNRDGGGRDFI